MGTPSPSANPHANCLAVAASLADALRGDQVDVAIEAGLMSWQPCPHCHGETAGHADNLRVIEQARLRLHTAWAARERYRSRQARLARRAAERDARRAPLQIEQKPALPPAAAAILARAKARAAQGKPDA